MLVFDGNGPMDAPAHFVVLDWRAGHIVRIRDFLFAPYALEASEWLRLS
jgi:RNA polymerase sigma-70 factor (ECF subfamily)